jgi:hypothetical protein
MSRFRCRINRDDYILMQRAIYFKLKPFYIIIHLIFFKFSGLNIQIYRGMLDILTQYILQTSQHIMNKIRYNFQCITDYMYFHFTRSMYAMLHISLHCTQLPNVCTACSELPLLLTAHNPWRFQRHYLSKSCRESSPCVRLCYPLYVIAAWLGLAICSWYRKKVNNLMRKDLQMVNTMNWK